MMEIPPKEAIEFLLPKHYSGRAPSVSKAFGWFKSDKTTFLNLVAVCTFGKPASASLCKGVCGEQWSNNVYELNRLCRTNDWKEPLSQFVSYCLKQLKPLNWIIVSYSDMAMQHHGYIYQACNFIYTGQSKPRTDMYTAQGTHSRHYDASEQIGLRKVRSAKHRYIYFCAENKRIKKQMLADLNYPIMSYPKGDNNPDYILGNYLTDNIKLDERVAVKMNDAKLQLFKDRQIKAKDIFRIEPIDKGEAYNFVRKYHYLGDTKFFSMYNYGLIERESHQLVGCATYSLPQGTEALQSWFGLDNDVKDILELSRLCMLPCLNGTNATSFLLGNSMKLLHKENIRAVITLATQNRHVGSIYQVCNFKYYGLSDQKSDFYREDNKKNPRGETKNVHGVWVTRPRKHRYAYIMDKSLKCLLPECNAPKQNNIVPLECCNDTHKVYDNRFNEYYSCPICTGKLIHINGDIAIDIVDALVKQSIAHEHKGNKKLF